MKLAKTILCGVSALTLATGTAFAGASLDYGASSTDGSFSTSQPSQVYEPEQFVVLEPVDITYVDVYDVDVDGDGRIDGQLLLEQSDTTAMSSSAGDFETPMGG